MSEIPTDVLLEFQKQRLSPDGLRALGAFGSAIGRRIHQKSKSVRDDEGLCIRVFVDLKMDDGDLADAQKLTKDVPFDFAGRTWHVPIDICEFNRPTRSGGDDDDARYVSKRAGAGMHQAKAPEFLDTRPGTIGGWAWDRASRAIVGISAQHVLGAESGRVEAPIYEKEDKRIGTVRQGRPLALPPESNPFDCALMDPDVSHADRLLTFAPPIQSAMSRPLLGWDVDRPVRRPDQSQGTVRGRIDQFSAAFAMPEMGGRADEPGFFAQIGVIANRGQFSSQGDSGGLAYLDDEDEFGAPKVLGMVIGEMMATERYPGRSLSVISPIAPIFADFGLETTATAPLFAFLDSLFDPEVRDTPFSLLRSASDAERRLPTREGSSAALVRALEELNWSPGIIGPMRKHRSTVLRSLVSDAHLRTVATRALAPLLAGKESPEAVFTQILSAEAIVRLNTFIDALGDVKEPGMRGAMDRFSRQIIECEGKTVGTMLKTLGRTAEAMRKSRPSTPGRASQVIQLL